MRKPKIGVVIQQKLLGEIFTPEDRARLDKLGRVTWCQAEEKCSSEEAIAVLQGCEVGVGSWGTPHPSTEGLLEACPDLRLWVHAAGTVKYMFTAALKDRDLVIASCAPATAEQVAEVAVGELILGVRRILENAARNRLGKTSRPANCRGLGESTIGIIGASQVGRRVIGFLKPFGPRILLFDPYVSKKEARQLGAELRSSVTDLCRECDALSIHAPANPDCEKMVGRKQLAAMKDDCVIVNTARGIIIDEAALIDELQKGRLFAFLDVTRPEPADDDSPLRKLPNVVLTSHIAGGQTPRIGAQVVRDVKAWIASKPLTMTGTWKDLDRVA
jgi:phosphoglycerate dehydrogenase-like enzyme